MLVLVPRWVLARRLLAGPGPSGRESWQIRVPASPGPGEPWSWHAPVLTSAGPDEFRAGTLTGPERCALEPDWCVGPPAVLVRPWRASGPAAVPALVHGRPGRVALLPTMRPECPDDILRGRAVAPSGTSPRSSPVDSSTLSRALESILRTGIHHVIEDPPPTRAAADGTTPPGVVAGPDRPPDRTRPHRVEPSHPAAAARGRPGRRAPPAPRRTGPPAPRSRVGDARRRHAHVEVTDVGSRRHPCKRAGRRDAASPVRLSA